MRSKADWCIYGALLVLTFVMTTIIAAADGPAMAGFVACGGAVLTATHATTASTRGRP